MALELSVFAYEALIHSVAFQRESFAGMGNLRQICIIPLRLQKYLQYLKKLM